MRRFYLVYGFLATTALWMMLPQMAVYCSQPFPIVDRADTDSSYPRVDLETIQPISEPIVPLASTLIPVATRWASVDFMVLSRSDAVRVQSTDFTGRYEGTLSSEDGLGMKIRLVQEQIAIDGSKSTQLETNFLTAFGDGSLWLHDRLLETTASLISVDSNLGWRDYLKSGQPTILGGLRYLYIGDTYDLTPPRQVKLEDVSRTNNHAFLLQGKYRSEARWRKLVLEIDVTGGAGVNMTNESKLQPRWPFARESTSSNRFCVLLESTLQVSYQATDSLQFGVGTHLTSLLGAIQTRETFFDTGYVERISYYGLTAGAEYSF